MLKTCYNCKSYYTVCDGNNHDCHWHNFCSQWEMILKAENMYGEWNIPEGHSYYDDMECGVAGCYMFDPLPEPFAPDEWFLANKKHNDLIVEKFKCPDNMDDRDCPDRCPKKDYCPW